MTVKLSTPRVFFAALAFLLIADSAYPFQCPAPPGTCSQTPTTFVCATAGTTCCVYTEQDLREALDCNDDIGTDKCCNIIIPEGVTLTIGDNFVSIGDVHAGLRLIINGTLKFTGTPGPTKRMLRLSDAVGVTIESTTGTGVIKSDYIPCQQSDPEAQGCECIIPSNGLCDIATAIYISGGHNITIRNLKFYNLSDMVKCEQEFTSSLTLEDLTAGTSPTSGDGMIEYGAFVLMERQGQEDRNKIIDCVVHGAYSQHCFRAYASELDITSSEGSFSRRASGLWLLEGRDVTVDGFDSGTYVRVGPNFACCEGAGPDDGTGPDGLARERLRGADLRDINAVENMEVELGTMGAYLFDVDVADMNIGRVPGEEDNIVPRPFDRIHWGQVTLDPGEIVTVADSACTGTDIGTCLADANEDGDVDIDDLLIVISDWGTCPAPWNDQPLGGSCALVSGSCVFTNIPDCTTPVNNCRGDLVPYALGNRIVDIDDLLLVIMHWGPCGGPGEDFPNGIMDCFNIYCDGLTGEEWEECLEKCFEAYCLRFPEDCE
jgi:hypothetical protein